MLNRKFFHAPYIDGLRAIAVISVIFYHLNPNYFPGGFAGVDVFFVISGFVVAMSVSGFMDLRLRDVLVKFYARRLLRIYPALILCLLCTFVISALFIPQAWLSSTNDKSGLMAFFGLSNFTLAADAGGYFSPRSEFNPFTHTWSLAVEEQFYLVFPFLFYVWLKQRKYLSVALFSIGFVCSLIFSIYLSGSNPVQGFYSIGSRFWELGVGVLLFQGMSLAGYKFATGDVACRRSRYLGGVALLFLGASFLFAKENQAPFPTCVPIVVATAAVLWLMYGTQRGFAHYVLTNRWAVLIGKMSYSLYLWHWPVFVFMRWTIGLDSVGLELVALCLTAALSFCSFRLVEQPVRYAFKSVRQVWVVVVGLALICVGASLSYAVVRYKPAFTLSTVTRNHALWDPDGVGVFTNEDGCKLTVRDLPLQGGLLWQYGRSGCDDQAPTFGHNIFVIGDSHAMHYRGMLKKFTVDTGGQVYLYQFPGCAFIPLRAWNPASCDEPAKIAAADILSRIKIGDVVFLPSLRIERFVDQWVIFGVDASREGTLGQAAQAARSAQIKESIPMLREFADKGAHIVFEAPTPMLLGVPYRCSDWFNRYNPICGGGLSVSRALIEELRQPVLAAYDEISLAVPKVSVWDGLPILCPGSTCLATKDDDPLFFDGDHLTFFSNMLLLPSFSEHVMDGLVD